MCLGRFGARQLLSPTVAVILTVSGCSMIGVAADDSASPPGESWAVDGTTTVRVSQGALRILGIDRYGGNWLTEGSDAIVIAHVGPLNDSDREAILAISRPPGAEIVFVEVKWSLDALKRFESRMEADEDFFGVSFGVHEPDNSIIVQSDTIEETSRALRAKYGSDVPIEVIPKIVIDQV